MHIPEESTTRNTILLICLVTVGLVISGSAAYLLTDLPNLRGQENGSADLWMM